MGIDTRNNPKSTTISDLSKPTPTKTFSIELKPARKLKLAIAALCESGLNPEGLGRIDVDENGFDISVQNVETNAIAHLWLGANEWNKFYCSESFDPKMVDLDRVFVKLGVSKDGDTVRIYHILNSDELTFTFGDDPPTMFSVKLLEPRPELRKCPVLKAASGVAMPSQHLREMILHMVQDGIPQRVLVNMTEQNVKITVGNMELKYEKDEISGTKGWQPGERFCGWLRWPHCKSLKIASISARVVFLCLVTDFCDSFMLRFIINKDWKLTYMKQNNDFAELASSQGNKIVNAGLTERNLTYSFKFLVLPAVTLKFALLSLTEYSFLGSTGLGMIDVNENRFQFTVRNSETGVVGLIHLVASRLINFRCNNDVQGIIVNLEHIAQNLFLTHDNDIIVIYQVDGSNEISFNSGRIESLVRGTGSSRKFAAQLLGSIVEFEDCPDLNNFKCEANIPSQHLREMIPLFIANESPQSVSMEIEYGFVSITIGQQSWDYDYDEKLLEQHHHICFEWPHSESLKWASFLADQFSIRILTDPPNCIMLRFKLQDFGHLIYIKQVDFTRPTLKDKLQHGVATKLTSSRYWPQRYTWTGCYCPQQYADMLDLEDSEQNSSTEASPCSFEQSESACLLIC